MILQAFTSGDVAGVFAEQGGLGAERGAGGDLIPGACRFNVNNGQAAYTRNGLH